LEETDMNVDINTLTLGEVAAVEDLSGLAIDQLGEEGVKKGRLYAAIIFVLNKRANPDYKFEDALNLDMAALADMFQTDPDPKDKN
jgi:hypothetical protein